MQLIKISRAETDSPEFSSLAYDFDAAQAFRAETISYAQKCLTGDEVMLDSERPTNPLIASFRPIGEAISKSYTA
ncbi:MAG: hypothetical protein Q9217_006955, partial [Psora testacea]